MTKLEEMLIRHEAMKLKPYICPAGKVTIGVGRNIEDVGISESEAMFMLRNDIDRCRHEMSSKFFYFEKLSDVRQDVVLSMVFNMGLPRFLTFKKLAGALIAQDYEEAAVAMLDSKWSRQVGARASELATMMKTGSYYDKLK